MTFILTSKTNTVPKFLCLTNVEMNLDVIGTGGFGCVYRARYKEQEVAMKLVYKSRHDVSTLLFAPFVNADPFRQGLAKRRLPAGSHNMAIPLTPFYPPLSGNI